MLKVINELGPHSIAVGLVGCAENGRRVVRGGDPRDIIAGEEFTAVPGEPEIVSEHGLGRRGAHADENFGLDHENFGMKPWPAGFDLATSRLLVQSTLAARLPTKVLDGIRNVHLVARYTSLVERIVQQPAGGPDKRVTLLVFFIAWYFAKQNHVCAARSFAEDRLGGILIQVATFAVFGRTSQRTEIYPRWQEICCRNRQ